MAIYHHRSSEISLRTSNWLPPLLIASMMDMLGIRRWIFRFNS